MALPLADLEQFDSAHSGKLGSHARNIRAVAPEVGGAACLQQFPNTERLLESWPELLPLLSPAALTKHEHWSGPVHACCPAH